MFNSCQGNDKCLLIDVWQASLRQRSAKGGGQISCYVLFTECWLNPFKIQSTICIALLQKKNMS
jgi:hypothetical protein